jgi:tetratricopeptide (TPR) repeat protein
MLPVGIALGGLIVGAGLVFFALPRWVAERDVAAPAQSEAPPAETEPAPAEVFSPEELERLRAQAETLLAELLSQQSRLEQLSVESWGDQVWRDYEAEARAGDDAYLANAFQDAVPAYRRALDLGETLLGRSDRIVAAALQAGATALEAGNATLAAEQFALVLTIEPDNETAVNGRDRAQRLPEVLDLVERAQSLERDGALEEAARLFRDALAIDPGWAPARSALAGIESRLQNRRFETLMSQGFAALASEDFDASIEHFSAALMLRPGSEEAAAGRLQAEQGQRLDAIALIDARAAAFERRELWDQAIAQYEAALAEDPTLVFAQQGLARARARADLDSKLRHLLSNPNLLFDDRVLADARTLLTDAQNVAEPGQRLAEQTGELDRLLRLASTPIGVELESDQLTEVTVYRVGPLGTFARTTLELRPGTYTAIGSRDGYRDVRETFTVLPGRPLPPIRVACVEPI